MSILGVQIHRPGFWPFTRAVAFAIVFWLLLLASPLGATSTVGAGASLAAMIFGCISDTIGIDLTKGGRHLAVNIAGCLLVLLAYTAIASLF